MDEQLLRRAAEGGLVGGVAGLLSGGFRGFAAGFLLGASAAIALHEAAGRRPPVVLSTEEALVRLRRSRN